MIMIGEARSSSDVEQASDIMLRAFEGRENARLGRGYARAMLNTFANESSRVLLVAVDDGRIAGFAAGEPGAAVADRYRALRPAAARSLALKPWLMCSPQILRMALKRLNADGRRGVAPDSWFLALIAVDPARGRHGIGRQLLHAFEQEGAARGFTHATLHVAATNQIACGMYSTCGWQTDGMIRDGRLRYERQICEQERVLTAAR